MRRHSKDLIFTVLGDSRLLGLVLVLAASLTLLIMSACTVDYVKGPNGEEIIKIVPGCEATQAPKCPDKTEREKNPSPLSEGKAPDSSSGADHGTYLVSDASGVLPKVLPGYLHQAPASGAFTPYTRRQAENFILPFSQVNGGSRRTPTCVNVYSPSRFRTYQDALRSTERAPISIVQDVYCWTR